MHGQLRDTTLGSLLFMIYSPEYCPEIVPTDLETPVRASAAIALVAQLRAADAHRRTPRLVPSNPQLSDAPATLLALPHWPFCGIAVLFDCRASCRALKSAFWNPSEVLIEP